MKKLGILLLAMLFLTGCVNTLTITKEQNDMVAEYIANTLLKYDKNYEYKLVSLSATEAATDEIVEQITQPTQEVDPETTNTTNTANTDNSQDNKDNGPKEVKLSKVIGNNNISIKNKGYSVTSSFKDKDIFNIEASKGKKLLILDFSIKNKSNESQRFNIMNNEIFFKATIDDNKSYTPLLTYYVKDIANYDMNIKAGETIKGVLFFEIDNASAEDISKISIYAVKKNNIAIIAAK